MCYKTLLAKAWKCKLLFWQSILVLPNYDIIFFHLDLAWEAYKVAMIGYNLSWLLKMRYWDCVRSLIMVSSITNKESAMHLENLWRIINLNCQKNSADEQLNRKAKHKQINTINPMKYNSEILIDVSVPLTLPRTFTDILLKTPLIEDGR